jgi:membrane-associated HD superfamily phosphohydrolase
MPRMSALILGNHVKQGLELADEYRLPTTIRNIIQQHHGTTVMPFFYQKALEKNGEEVHENDYRYLGPKPQTKESAIVMLADAVEASARALREPTHSRLKGLIIDLVEERFQEGQLNEAPLTLADLEKIKDSFLTILAATFHARVGYDKED